MKFMAARRELSAMTTAKAHSRTSTHKKEGEKKNEEN